MTKHSRNSAEGMRLRHASSRLCSEFSSVARLFHAQPYSPNTPRYRANVSTPYQKKMAPLIPCARHTFRNPARHEPVYTAMPTYIQANAISTRLRETVE